ncbi:MAG: hypothetical protein EOP49_32600, partial [Sphingobacteriales bacterium]
MNRIQLLLCLFLLSAAGAFAQTPVQMATLPALIYNEDFADIDNWTSGFTAGIGAAPFGGVAAGGVGTIPNPNRITQATTSFAGTGSSGGVHRDSTGQRILLLATGTADNTNATALDLYLDYTGTNAGTLSFDWASVNNGANTSNRKGSLRVYGTTDGINFTELTDAAVLNITNYDPTSGSIVNVSLPASFNNSATARLRFYYYNGTGGSSGSRPYIALDNIAVTASGNPCSLPGASASFMTF